MEPTRSLPATASDPAACGAAKFAAVRWGLEQPNGRYAHGSQQDVILMQNVALNVSMKNELQAVKALDPKVLPELHRPSVSVGRAR